MAFLFKSKKNQQGAGLPPATRNIHTSEGAPQATAPGAPNAPKDREGSNQTPTPSSSYNNSLNSVNSTNSPDHQRVRQRAESESQVSNTRPMVYLRDPSQRIWRWGRITANDP